MSISSGFLWRFLEDVWDLLPSEDRELFQAYWSGQLQIAGNLEQKAIEAALSTQVADVPVFLTDRWARYLMNEETCDLFSQTDTLTLSGTAESELSRKTAFYETLVVGSPSGKIQHEETLRFFDDAVRALRYGGIVKGTISVTFDGFEFVQNRDYVLNRESGTIQALEEGRIPPTEIMTIRYQHAAYTLGLDYEVDELRATVRRTATTAIPNMSDVAASYTYNATATLPLVGTRGSVLASTLTDASKDFSTLISGRTLTITSGPNAGTYPINSVLSPNQILVDGTFLVTQETDVEYSINAFPHGVKVDTNIASIPLLQDLIDAPGTVMVEGVDYRVSGGILSSRAAFPLSALGPEDMREHQVWAQVTKVDRETPYRNFGVLIDFYRANSEAYKLALQGLWYTFWTGSTPGNLQRGLHILLGLPFAKFAGTVSRVDTDLGEIDITEPRGRIITYAIPDGLEPAVSRLDEVARFDALTTGVTIIDRNNEPGFVANRLGRSGISRYLATGASVGPGDTDETRALTLLENHLFLPQILVEAITQRVNVTELVTFLDNMKPQWTEYVFSFIASEEETVYFSEDLPPPDLDINLTSTINNNTWNQAFQFDLHRLQKASALPPAEPSDPADLVNVHRFNGEIIAGGTQAAGNFRVLGIDLADLGVDEGDFVVLQSGLFMGHHEVVRRISSSVLSLDIPDAAIVGATGLEYFILPFERRMDNDLINIRNEHLKFAGTDYPAPASLNTKTDIDLASTSLRNGDVTTLLLVDIGIGGDEVQAITDADVDLNEIDVGTSPGVVTRDHEIAAAALVRTDNLGPTVTDAYAI